MPSLYPGQVSPVRMACNQPHHPHATCPWSEEQVPCSASREAGHRQANCRDVI